MLRSILATSLYLGSFALVHGAKIPHVFERAATSACNADNCLRAVRATGTPTRLSTASADCSSFFQSTVTPCPTTTTITISQTTTLTDPTAYATASTTTVSTETDTSYSVFSSTVIISETTTLTDPTVFITTSTSTVSTETDTSYSTAYTTITSSQIQQRDNERLNERQTICPATSAPSAVPTYATACSGAVRYSSACSCLGVTASVTTLPASIQTVYVTAISTSQTTPLATVTTTLSSATTEVTTSVSTSINDETSVSTVETTPYATVTDIISTATTTVTTLVSTSAIEATPSSSCLAISSNCSSPTFIIRFANGTYAGSFVYIPYIGPTMPFTYVRSTTSQSQAAQFTVDSSGRLTSVAHGLVYYPTSNTEAGTLVFGSTGRATSSYDPVYVQLGCGPACPGASGSLLLTAANAPYNTWAYCNGVTEVVVNSQNFCGPPNNIGYLDALNFIAV